MDFKDRSKHMAERISALKESIQTEEATKNEVKHRLETIDDIYLHQDALKNAIQKYL